ncbi:MAG TPA: protein-glutamate O-methyltransferase [Thermodesulfobacteriota bacterium]|nr:protein-glutamate O-methyltransferase [Thermodesulfobacteriota bacterium]
MTRAVAPAGVPPITDAEFGRFQALIERTAGIHLHPGKRALLVSRLARRLRELGVGSFGEYYRLVEQRGEEELIRLLDLVTTNETQFFRERRHFEFLVESVLPAWRQAAAAGSRPRRVRVWSAGCSTGEEPYSIAMVLLDALPPQAGWQIEILATDLSTRALARARAGVWPIEKAAGIPLPYLKAFMLRGTGPEAGRMKAGPELRRVIAFERMNLADDTWRVAGPFDLVFCRNVLIYFAAERRARVVERLVDRLAPGGYLFLGHAEGLCGASGRVRTVEPTVYVRPGPGGEARAPGRARPGRPPAAARVR